MENKIEDILKELECWANQGNNNKTLFLITSEEVDGKMESQVYIEGVGGDLMNSIIEAMKGNKNVERLLATSIMVHLENNRNIKVED